VTTALWIGLCIKALIFKTRLQGSGGRKPAYLVTKQSKSWAFQLRSILIILIYVLTITPCIITWLSLKFGRVSLSFRSTSANEINVVVMKTLHWSVFVRGETRHVGMCYPLQQWRDSLHCQVLNCNLYSPYFFLERSICYSNPCMNGGTCLDETYGYRCSCRMGYSGMNCQSE